MNFLRFFFFFTGSRLQLPATRQSRESHGPTASLGSQQRGAAIRRMAALPDPRDSRLGTAQGPGHPPSARLRERARGLLSLKASLPRPSPPSCTVTHAARCHRSCCVLGMLPREGASPGPHLNPHIQVPQPHHLNNHPSNLGGSGAHPWGG